MSPIFLKLLPLNLSISLLYLSQFLRRWSSTLLPIQSSLAKSIQQSESTAPWGRTTRSVCTPQLLSLCLSLFLPQWHTHTHTVSTLHLFNMIEVQSESSHPISKISNTDSDIQTHERCCYSLSPLVWNDTFSAFPLWVGWVSSHATAICTNFVLLKDFCFDLENPLSERVPSLCCYRKFLVPRYGAVG